MFQRRETHFRLVESNITNCDCLYSSSNSSTLGIRTTESNFANNNNSNQHQLLRLTAAGSGCAESTHSRQQQQQHTHSQREEARKSSCRNSAANNNNRSSNNTALLLKATLRRIVIAIATIRLTSTTTSTSTAATVTSSTTSASFVGALVKSLLIGFYYILAFISLLMLILYINRSFHSAANQHHQAGSAILSNIKGLNSIVELKDGLQAIIDTSTNQDEYTKTKSFGIFQQNFHHHPHHHNHRKNLDQPKSNSTRTKRSLEVTVLKYNTNDNNKNPPSLQANSREQQQQNQLFDVNGTKTLPRSYTQKPRIDLGSTNITGGNDNTVSSQDSSQKSTSLAANNFQKDYDPLISSASNNAILLTQNHQHRQHSPIAPSINIKTSPNQVNQMTLLAQYKRTELNAKSHSPNVPLPELNYNKHAMTASSLNSIQMLNNHSIALPFVLAKPTTLLRLQASSAEVQWIPILKPLELIANIRTPSAQERQQPSPLLMINNPILTHYHAKPTNLNNAQQMPPQLYSNLKLNSNNNNKNNVQTSHQSNTWATATAPLLASSTQALHLLPEASYRASTGIENFSPNIQQRNQGQAIQLNHQSLHRGHHYNQQQPQQHHHHHLHEHHHFHLNHRQPKPVADTARGASYRHASNHQWRQPRLNSHHMPRFTKMYKRILLCDKTLVSLDYVRNPYGPPPMGPHIPFNHPINQPHYDVDGADDFDDDNIIDLDTNNIESVVVDRSSSTSANTSSASSISPNVSSFSTSVLNAASSNSIGGAQSADERSDETLMLIDKRSLLADDDPLVKCDMWDLEKGLKNRKPPKEILQMAIKADFDTVRDAINRCRQLSEKTLPSGEDGFRDGLEIMSAEDLVSLFSMKRGLIPGTKWCGLGDQASTYNDLGPKHRIDICCRAHDHCPIRLKPFRNDYGVLNIALYTKSHCDCDADFYRCLREAHSRTADMLGNLYFNVMKLQCMREERMKICREMK